MKMPSASDGAYDAATTDEADEMRSASVALAVSLRLASLLEAYRSNLVMSSYIVFSRSITGLVRLRSSYNSKRSKSSTKKVPGLIGPTS